MRLVVESWNKKFDRLIPAMRRTALKLGRFFRLRNAQVEIYLVGNDFMKKNVLSFPAPKNFPRPDLKKGIKSLGEIYLNPDYIAKEKFVPIRQLTNRGSSISNKIKDFDEIGKITNPKLVYMLIHGFLHLLGYDHINKNDRIRMQKKELFLLKKL